MATSEELQKASSFAWVIANNIINENGQLLEFEDHFFMIDPFNDNHPDIVVKKSAQIGWSVTEIVKAIHDCAAMGVNIIHTLPTQNVIKDFVIPKVNPIVYKNACIKELLANDSVSLKKFGDNFIYYRGSFVEREAISITADILINDEYDRSDQRILAIYQSRLQASKYKWIRRFSNPSIKGFGVDELYESSDQMHWFIKCKGCNKKQYLTFEDNIDMENREYICKYCKKILTVNERRLGKWIAKYPSRTHRRGYWINQLMCPWVDAGYIVDKSKDDPAFFANFVLGQAYTEAEILVDRSAIVRKCVPGYIPKEGVCMGVDNGIVKHWVLGTKEGIFAYGKTDDWGEIERLIVQYNAYCVIDQNPYPNKPRQLVEKHKGKVFVNSYVQDRKALGTIQFGEGKELGMVKSDRTKILDMVAAEITADNGLIHFSLTPTRLDEYIEHWQNIYRGTEVNTQGIKRGVWLTKENRADHFAHATVYWYIALQRTLKGDGRVISADRPNTIEYSPTVTNNTIPGMDVKKVIKDNQKKRRDWKR